MAILQQIESLLGGVSQAPPHMRDTSEAQEQINGLSHPARGLRKRPPTEHQAKLTASTVGFSSAYDYSLMVSATERYRLIVVNGDLQIFDAITGAPITTYFPFGKAYLADSAAKGFRAVTVGDQVILLNRGVLTGKDATQKSAADAPQALLWVQKADYQSTYTVTINGQVVAVTTPASTADNARSFLNTDYIANQLLQQMQPNFSAFVLTRYGSVIHVVRADSADFTVTVTDGFGGTGFTAVKGSAQNFINLPSLAKAGMIVAITGTPESTAAPYYMKYDDLGTPGKPGVWRETTKPGVLLRLDGTTMPWRVTRNGAIVDSLKSNSVPAIPVTSGGSTSHTDNGFNVSGSETSSPSTQQHNGYVRGKPSGTDGTSRALTVVYDVITSAIRDGSTVTVELWTDNGAGTFTKQATSGAYYGGSSYMNEKLQYTGALPANCQVDVRLVYSGGVQPPSGTYAILLGHGKGAAGGSGIQTDVGSGTLLTVDPARTYPVGSAVVATLDGTPFTYNVTVNDQSGSTVAAGLQALINPSAGFRAAMQGSNAVLVTKVAGGPPTTTVITVTFDPTVTCHLVGAGLTPGGLVGFTVKNLTDGSSGVITANTATTITVAALAGGSANKFSAGDVVSVFGAGTYFVLAKATWNDRAVGDDTSAPFPSFTGRSLDELFFFQNRLGFCSRDSVVMSRTGDRFNFFRGSAAQVLANDPIDINSNVRKVAAFSSAVHWHEGVYLLSDSELFRLSGNPLAPQTVRLDAQGEYPSAASVRPIVAGGRLIMCSVKNGYTRVGACTRTVTYAGEDIVDAKDITRQIPSYIVGNPLMLAVDPELQMLAILTDGAARRSLYVGTYQFNAEQFQAAWSRWDFPLGSTIIGMDILNGVVSLVVLRRDGVHLETMTLDPSASITSLLYDGTATFSGTYTNNGVPA